MKNHIQQFIDQLPPEYEHFSTFLTELQVDNAVLEAENAKLKGILQKIRRCDHFARPRACAVQKRCFAADIKE